MIGANKQLFKAAGKLSRLAVSLEDHAYCGGFVFSDGALGAKRDAAEYEGKSGVYVLPEECDPEALYFVRSEKGISSAAYANGQMYACFADGGTFVASQIPFARAPSCARVFDGGKEGVFLSDGEVVYVLKKGELSAVVGVPAFDCAGYAYERLWTYTYADDGHRVCFSALGDARDFSENNYYDLPDAKGKVLAFAELDGDFCVVRQYGAQTLSVRGKEDSFELSDLPSPAVRIFEGTVCAENGAVFCLSEGGLMRFSGGKGEIICSELAGAVPRGGACDIKCIACGGKVYVFFHDGRGVFVTDASGEEKRFIRREFTAPALGFTSDGVAVFGVCGRKLYAFGAGKDAFAGEKVWKSREIFPFDGAKGALEELIFSADGTFDVHVQSECGERSFRFVVSGESKRVRPSLRGSCFCYEIVCVGEEGSVRSLTAGYSERG